MTLTLRPVTERDTDFLFTLYATTRAEEMAMVPWDDEQKRAFLSMQCTAQRADYEARFPHSSHSIVVADSEDVGRIWIDRSPEEIRLLDIALMAVHRNKGLGHELLECLQFEAAETATALRHSVSSLNSNAQRFYEDLGFAVIEDLQTYVLMEWTPE